MNIRRVSHRSFIAITSSPFDIGRVAIFAKSYQSQDEGKRDEHESKSSKWVRNGLFYGFGLGESTGPIYVHGDSGHCKHAHFI